MVKTNCAGMASERNAPAVPSDPEVAMDVDTHGAFTDEELTELALDADPDAAVEADAVSLFDAVSAEGEGDRGGLLPGWYMPAVASGLRPLHGWKRRVVWLIIASFLLINAYGLRRPS